MPEFLTSHPAAHAALREAAAAVADALAAADARHPGPWSGADPAELARGIAALDPCPDQGRDLTAVLGEVADAVLAHGVRIADPRTAAHLHPPALLAAAAAELAIGATNQSMDAFDASPAATLVEDHLVRWLAGLLGLPAGATGVMTSGGTASNLYGLLLAREHAARRTGAVVARDGLPSAARGWRILTSAAAHFSVRRSAGMLGLGSEAVVPVATDARGRLDVAALDAALARLEGDGLLPIAIVATAGTTDLGAIDPLAAVADRAAAAGAWLHVDAALGAGLALSPRLGAWLDGIGRADSVTADLHKLFWIPFAASALLVRDPALLEPVRHHADYLNRAEDEAAGTVNLATRSLDTSRRFDALKALVALRATGRARMAELVEHVVALTRGAAEAVARHPDLELLAEPSTVTVVFRARGGDELNTEVQRRLFASGRAVVGRTRLDGAVALKLTLVNPLVSAADIDALLDLIAAEAARLRSVRGP
jgi:L-2,4-diaminobutyrate decarboxylase